MPQERLDEINRASAQDDGRPQVIRLGGLTSDLTVINVGNAVQGVKDALRHIIHINSPSGRMEVVNEYIDRP